MSGPIREALHRARVELDHVIDALDHTVDPPDAGDGDLMEVRSRLAVLETRVSAIESQRGAR